MAGEDKGDCHDDEGGGEGKGQYHRSSSMETHFLELSLDSSKCDNFDQIIKHFTGYTSPLAI